MDIRVLLETKTLVFFIFSLREIWKTLCAKGPEFARALWFPPLLVLPLLVCSSQRRLLDSLWAFQMSNEVTFSKEMENENTAKKTGDDVTRIFREYLDTTQERRDIIQILFPDLQKSS